MPPRPLVHVGSDVPATKIFTDASDWGWGAICVRVEVANGGWSAGNKFSAHSEPLAVFMALCRFVSPLVPSRVLIFTDHRPLTFYTKSGYSKSYPINQILNDIRSQFPLLDFSCEYVKGEDQPADGLSRGFVEDDGQQERLQRLGILTSVHQPPPVA